MRKTRQRDRAAKVIAALLNVARPIMREVYVADNCIASTAIVREVLRRFGMQLQPLTTQVRALNPPLAAYLLSNGGEMPDRETTQALGGLDMQLGSGREERPDDTIWPYHLIGLTTIEGRDLVIDLSLDQLNRYGYDFGPICVPCPPGFAKGRQQYDFLWSQHLVSYHPRPDITSWRSAPLWYADPLRPIIVERIVTAMRQDASVK